MKFKIRSKIMAAILALSFFICAWAANDSPVGVMEQVANQMISSLEKNKSRLKHSNGLIYQIVERVLVPHIDLDRMAGSVVGREYWMKASAAERQTFINEFSKLVISTYSAALASYDGDRVQFYPLRNGQGSSAQVNSIVLRKNGQRIPISYNLSRAGNTWKVYDFTIENISMAQSYRSQFSDVLVRSGLAGLNQRLIKHNRGVK